MKNVYLHGYLGKMFGKHWELEVLSVAEAIRAIDANVKGKLREYWTGKGRAKKYMIKLGGYTVSDIRELVPSCGDSTDIHIVPYVSGASSGFGKILAAIAIIVVSYYTFGGGSTISGSTQAGTGLFGMTAAQTASMGYQIGAQLILGGVMQLLSPVPNFNTGAGDTRSNIFDGNSTYAVQGGSVPLVYGRMLIGPMPVSISLENADRSTATQYAGGGSSAYSDSMNANSVGNGQYQYTLDAMTNTPMVSWPKLPTGG